MMKKNCFLLFSSKHPCFFISCTRHPDIVCLMILVMIEINIGHILDANGWNCGWIDLDYSSCYYSIEMFELDIFFLAFNRQKLSYYSNFFKSAKVNHSYLKSKLQFDSIYNVIYYIFYIVSNLPYWYNRHDYKTLTK